MTTAQQYTVRRIGTSTYEVLDGNTVKGTVWRTRDGWSGRSSTGELVIEDSPVSRGVAVNMVGRYTATWEFGGAYQQAEADWMYGGE